MAYRTLVVVSLFQALSAVGGGVGMVVADGLSMPRSLLADSPFSTFFVPGLILAIVVGGSQTFASVRLLQHVRSAFVWSAVAGFGMVIWIVVEIGVIHDLGRAQMTYIITGLLQLMLVFSLLGIVERLPRTEQDDLTDVPPRSVPGQGDADQTAASANLPRRHRRPVLGAGTSLRVFPVQAAAPSPRRGIRGSGRFCKHVLLWRVSVGCGWS